MFVNILQICGIEVCTLQTVKTSAAIADDNRIKGSEYPNFSHTKHGRHVQ